jgi:hypothetical protein
MSSSRSVTALVIAVAATFSVAMPAHARPSPGTLNGYVTDADTGLGLGDSHVSWSGGTPITTDGSGRFLFTGLTPGTTGSLAVAGPAGWEKTTVDGVALPADDAGSRNVAVHRDWAAGAGGASTSSNDESGAPGGCGSGAATDNDRATGWSATVASHTAGDPAALTVALPQAISLRQVVIDPTSACGHGAGAALGRYRILTSTDGTTFTAAAEGTLSADQRGTNATITPTDATAAVRYVRLQALAPQDPAATTVDLRELQVFGLAPNQPPAGSLSVDEPKTYIKSPLHLKAAFTDGDSTITRYLWDFDGDGTYDQATTGPAVAHVWLVPGIYHVVVGVRDFTGGLGTASLDLRVTDPTALVEPILQRKPLITFDPVDGIDLPARIACSSRCTFTATLVLPKATAKAIKAKRRTILTFKRRTEGPGLGSWTLTLPNKTIKLLRRAHRMKVKVRLTASAVDQQKRRTTVHRWITFR